MGGNHVYWPRLRKKCQVHAMSRFALFRATANKKLAIAIGRELKVVPGACEVTAVARRNGDNVVRRFVVLLGFWAILTLTSVYATVDDAISRALEVHMINECTPIASCPAVR
jgi:hypothetical protein